MRTSHFLTPIKSDHPIYIQQNQRKRYHTQSAQKRKNIRTIPINILKDMNAYNTLNKSLSTQQTSNKKNLPTKNIPNIPTPVTKKSIKSFNPLIAYAVSTHHGLYHLINQDKISIHLSRLLIFSIFDGYNGSYASEYLKQTMLSDIMHNPQKQDMQKLLFQTFQTVDKKLLQQQKKKLDKSGSSALVCLIHKKTLFLASCGTSLCFAKTTSNSMIKLNNPHKCQNIYQYARVVSLGVRLYQTKINIQHSPNRFVEGPLRIYPSGFTFTRTLGNIEVKSKVYNSKHQAIISKPQIKYIKLDQVKWVCLCSQGLTQFMNQQQINDCISENQKLNFQNEHIFAQKCAQQIIRKALGKGCNQNVSIIILIFKQLNKKKQQAPKMIKDISLRYIGGKSTIIHQK